MGYDVRGALQPDGKVVVASCTYFPLTTSVARVDATGTVDASFASAGTRTIPDYCLRNVAVQPDGGIVLFDNPGPEAGRATTILRLQASGSSDATFGSGGVASIQVEGTLSDVLPRGDGKLSLPFATLGFGLLQLFSDGNRDTSFGTNGVIVADSGTGSPGYIVGVGATADGRLSLYVPNEVVRIAADGGMHERIALSAQAVPLFALQADGRMLLVGDAPGGSWHVRRFEPDGAADAAFGAREISPTHTAARALEILPDGRIAVALAAYPGGGGVVRLLSDGRFDPAFGSGFGAVTAVFPGDATDLSSIAPYGNRAGW
jgi:uncharacterized delta-60 repeat protein